MITPNAPFDYGRPRNPAWEVEARAFLKAHKLCVGCGRPATQVHHTKPFHLFPEFEMVKELWRPVEPLCHLTVGHLGDWALYEKLFDRYAAVHLRRVVLGKKGDNRATPDESVPPVLVLLDPGPAPEGGGVHFYGEAPSVGG